MISDLIEYYKTNGSYVLEQVYRHFLISIYGVLLAAIVAIPLGFYLASKKKLANWVISLANIIQTVPSLAMLAIVMGGFGLGPTTVIVTVFLYSILPILKNTYTAVSNVDENIIDAAKGLGMNRFQLIRKIQFPLSLSVIMGGIKNSMVLGIGVAAIGTFIGAGGLGDIISRGINVSDGAGIILAGAIPTALMAVVIDMILSFIENKLDKTKH
ncbi:ABC transporter permease [Helcococcus kunzii]|uniref:ABC transporter permease n=1 Tax=Helcococcus kunzii TaxID=40091 RepID=UPI0021A5F528|nr:ABC transporter permease [Helcococcus kunzii]MCT1795794.1 ABC transporter permease [Helcococcus kunzii]MCT1989373.1 ABC transporter permease [Helcococcus kunzii]